MINDKQLKRFIQLVLKRFDLYSDNAEKLLYEIACVESDCGTYIEQIGGNARGIFQMETETEIDLWQNFLSYRKDLTDKLQSVLGINKNNLSMFQSIGNLAYQIIMARFFFLRFAEPIPDKLEDRAMYWKKYWNTFKGKGTIEQYLLKAK